MKGRIALFLHQPKCSIESGNGILKALQPYYHFKIFTKWRLDSDFFDDVDMIAVPGGIGDSDSHEKLFQENGPKIQQFLKRGGRYLGICMGAYWADKYYFDILDGVRAVQYITRPGTDTRRPHAKAMPVTWLGQPEKMYFYDGCALVGDPTKFETIATYSNGDPMAIIQNRVGLIGCHPESEPSWYSEYHSWMKPHYHNGKHHQLLLDFTDRLMSK
jgi:glutamine amidotransferase-like uncharacterized protein